LDRPVLTKGFTITRIGPLPGYENSYASAIDASGRRIAALSYIEGGGEVYPDWPPAPAHTQGFVWDQGTLTPLLPPAGYQGSWAYGVGCMSERGQVVGTAAKVDAEGILIGKNPVRWDPDGVPQLLDLPAGQTEGSAGGINNLGQVTGWAGTDLGNNSPPEYWMLGESNVAVLWDRGAEPTVLPHLFAGGRSSAGSINEKGQITGWSGNQDLSTMHAVLWDKGQVIDLTPGATGWNEADGLNNRGQVVGITGDFAFLWENGVLTNLGALENDAWSWALSINRFGQVVGFSSGPPDDPLALGRGFLWENGQMVNLDALCDDPEDVWLINWPMHINDRGQIAGLGGLKDVNGEYQNMAFLLTPKQ
jgi:probable HAF family extracellular repeat protein